MTTYSHSRLGSYDTCPLKYKYQYIQKPDVQKRDSIEAFMGSRCHDSLEKLYKQKINCRLMIKEELLNYYQQLWESKWHDEIFIVNEDLSAQDYYQQGFKGLSEYYDKYQPFEEDKTIAIEHRIEIDLDGTGKYKLQGFIDRISEAGEGHYKIRDYKTERNCGDQSKYDKDRQLALYQIGLSNMFADIKSVELIWHNLIFNKEFKSVRNAEQLTQLTEDTIALIQRVETATEADDFPYNETSLCNWCDYYPICPAKKHLHLTEQLEPEIFQQDDGVKLVNRYSEIDYIMKELKSEKAAIEEDIFEFCKQLSVDVVRGNSRKVKVTLKPAFKYKYSLTKNDEEKEELLQFLKERGIIEKFTVLNPAMLNSQMKKDELAKEIKEILREHIILIEGKPRFSLSKV